MKSTITSDIIVAYSECPRKAFLLLGAQEKGVSNEYVQVIEQKRRATERKYINALKKNALMFNDTARIISRKETISSFGQRSSPTGLRRIVAFWKR